MSDSYNERMKWFTDRIGKRIYRNETSCECPACKTVGAHGLIIHDKDHALYILDVEGDITAEGGKLRYFDTPEEVKEFMDLPNSNLPNSNK